nr:LysR family transcriptional regulator [uncultured Merdimonas sp.]
MEFRNIVTFLKVAELKNFSKAAEKLGYSQSAVTVQIQQLEKELGVRLFERVGKGVALTESGQDFVFHANEILNTTRQAVESVKNHGKHPDQKEITGILKVGSVESVSTALLPEILMAFHRVCPRVEIVVRTAKRDALIEEIKENSLDLFLTLEKKTDYLGLVRRLLREEEIIFIAPQKMLPERGKVPLEDLARLPFVLTEQGESYRYELDRMLAEQDLQIRAQLEIGNTETIVHMVEAGFGASFLPHYSAAKALEEGTVSRVETAFRPLSMWLQLYYHKNKWISPQMDAFLSVAEEYFDTQEG